MNSKRLGVVIRSTPIYIPLWQGLPHEKWYHVHQEGMHQNSISEMGLENLIMWQARYVIDHAPYPFEPTDSERDPTVSLGKNISDYGFLFSARCDDKLYLTSMANKVLHELAMIWPNRSTFLSSRRWSLRMCSSEIWTLLCHARLPIWLHAANLLRRWESFWIHVSEQFWVLSSIFRNLLFPLFVLWHPKFRVLIL